MTLMHEIPADVRRHMGARIREMRTERRESQTHLAARIGVTQASLSNYETGKREVPLGVALILADALEVRLAELLDGVRVNPMRGVTL